MSSNQRRRGKSNDKSVTFKKVKKNADGGFSIKPPSRRKGDDEAEEEDFAEEDDFTGGYKLEPFNLREERETGSFDNEGNYVESRHKTKEKRKIETFEDLERARKGDDDSEDEKDNWLDEYDERVELFAAAGKPLPKVKVVRPNFDELESTAVPIDVLALKRRLVQLLQPGETVTSALKRTAKNSKSKDKTSKNEVFDELTEIADILLNNGFLEVFTTKREDVEESISKLSKKRGRGGNVEEDDDDDEEDSTISSTILQGKSLGEEDDNEESASNWLNNIKSSKESENKEPLKKDDEMDEDDDDEVKWEYKGGDGKLYGPYKTSEMINWKNMGYFNAENVVPVRRVRKESIYDEAEDHPFVPSNTIDFNRWL